MADMGGEVWATGGKPKEGQSERLFAFLRDVQDRSLERGPVGWHLKLGVI